MDKKPEDLFVHHNAMIFQEKMIELVNSENHTIESTVRCTAIEAILLSMKKSCENGKGFKEGIYDVAIRACKQLDTLKHRQRSIISSQISDDSSYAKLLVWSIDVFQMKPMVSYNIECFKQKMVVLLDAIAIKEELHSKVQKRNEKFESLIKPEEIKLENLLSSFAELSSVMTMTMEDYEIFSSKILDITIVMAKINELMVTMFDKVCECFRRK